jgi:hypothetical protein
VSYGGSKRADTWPVELRKKVMSDQRIDAPYLRALRPLGGGDRDRGGSEGVSPKPKIYIILKIIRCD